ncbi:MAG: hypothetical protein ACQCN6_11100 [Candidatus Bathyarchaeia archaeon]
MAQQQIKGEQLLRQLLGEWNVGIALKTGEDKVVAGCGEMTAEETEPGINSEIDTHIEGYEDYFENDLWSFDPPRARCTFLASPPRETPMTTSADGWTILRLNFTGEAPTKTKRKKSTFWLSG